MQRHLICTNPGCIFILDSHIDGASLNGVQNIVKKCPSCGSGWSSLCPFCNQELVVGFVEGLAHTGCCGRRLQAATQAA